MIRPVYTRGKHFTRRIGAALSVVITLSASASADPRLPGGATSATIEGVNSFSLPAANLSFDQRLNFSVGNSFFRNPWIPAPASTDARDGLGPLFNTNSCQGCHLKDGRGHPPSGTEDHAVSMLIRLSIPETPSMPRAAHQAAIPEPTYGNQFQDFSNPNVKPEGSIHWQWHSSEVELPDGTSVSLRQPEFQLTQLNYGPLHPDTQLSARVATPMIGLGLIEAIPEATLLHRADPEDLNGDGISGRPNWVWNIQAQQLSLGRFGWKAGQPTVEQQSAEAFVGDMGLTSRLRPAQNCTSHQADCQDAIHGGEPEVSDEILAFVTFYAKHLAPPTRPNALALEIRAGEAIFHQVGCADCHTPSHVTGVSDSPALSQQTIYPYSDFLLHDMGEALADHRPEFSASGNEWRTAPLWGLGDYQAVNGHTQLLHDGRARGVFEAILWHGGEAESSKQKVINLPLEQRERLLKFLYSL